MGKSPFMEGNWECRGWGEGRDSGSGAAKWCLLVRWILSRLGDVGVSPTEIWRERFEEHWDHVAGAVCMGFPLPHTVSCWHWSRWGLSEVWRWAWVGTGRILGFYSKRSGNPLKDSEWYAGPCFGCRIVCYCNIITIIFKAVFEDNTHIIVFFTMKLLWVLNSL